MDITENNRRQLSGLLLAAGLVSGCSGATQFMPGTTKAADARPAAAIPGVSTPRSGELWTIAQAFKQYEHTPDVELGIEDSAVVWDGSGSGQFALDPDGKVLAVAVPGQAAATALSRAYPWRVMKARASGKERWDILPHPGTRLENLKSQKIPRGWLRVSDSR